MKRYFIRLYIVDEIIGNMLNKGIDCGMLHLKNSFDGMGNVLAIYDVECSSQALEELTSMGVTYLPLDNYGDFEITCPSCGKRIEDNMLLKSYDNNVLKGKNIECECGFQTASVKFLGEKD